MLEITKLNDSWDTAMNEANTELLLNLVTDDYIRLMPNQSAIEGKEAFCKANKAFFEEYTVKDSRSVVEEIRQAGDWAYVRGTWSGKFVPKSGDKPSIMTGKWIDIRERQPDGTYKISRASGNYD